LCPQDDLERAGVVAARVDLNQPLGKTHPGDRQLFAKHLDAARLLEKARLNHCQSGSGRSEPRLKSLDFGPQSIDLAAERRDRAALAGYDVAELILACFGTRDLVVESVLLLSERIGGDRVGGGEQRKCGHEDSEEDDRSSRADGRQENGQVIPPVRWQSGHTHVVLAASSIADRSRNTARHLNGRSGHRFPI
jgi:hypothetical protein